MHTILFLKQCYIIFETLHHLLYEYYFIFFMNCCPSEIILFLKLSRMHRLKCRNCLMFVTTNIRVLYVHWKECVRKKGNSQMCSNCNSTWFMQVFNLHFEFSCLFPPSFHHLPAPFLCGLSLKIGMRSSGKVFHGSEETMQIVFFKNCKILN